MKDDYLWDRTGQPDPEIQQLEEILGELRYQPRPLEIPTAMQSRRNRYLAIAAAVALAVLGLGLWLGIQRQSPANNTASKPQEAKKESQEVAAVNPIDEKKLSTLSATNHTPATVEVNKDAQHRRQRAANSRRPRHIVTTPQMTAEEVAEAREAKERLMLALRMASSKLNYAQKKTQGSGPANQIHNQHKIG
jgi:hypothetical protein